MFVFLDTKTTGTGPEDRLCQFGLKSEVRQAVCELFNPGMPISIDAMSIHLITNKMVRGKTPFKRLQPHYIATFFLEAFKRLGGAVRQREPRRYEVSHVPAPVRNRDRLIGLGEPVMPRYERIAFEKPLVAVHGQPLAAFVCPGHPLLDAAMDLTLERHRDLLRRGRCAGG